MMTKDEALKMAIEALEDANNVVFQEWSIDGEYDKAINACKEALAQQSECKHGSDSACKECYMEALEKQDCEESKRLIADNETLIKINNELATEASGFFERGKEIAKWADEQNKQEPVAWREIVGNVTKHYQYNENKKGEALYTHPAKQMVQMMTDGTVKPVFTSLSDDDIDELLLQNPATHREFARAIEAKIRGK